jgi:hypothetical protein
VCKHSVLSQTARKLPTLGLQDLDGREARASVPGHFYPDRRTSIHTTAPLRERLQQLALIGFLGMNSQVSLLHLLAKAFPACCNLLHKACTPAISGSAASN